MLSCIDEDKSKFISEAPNIEELIERMRHVLGQTSRPCMVEMGKAVGIPLPTLYSFRQGRLAAPSPLVLESMLKFMAPGYRLMLASVEAA